MPSVRASALADVESVVHLAAVVGDPACARDPERGAGDQFRARRLRSSNEAAELEASSRFVFASTCSNYGKLEDGNAVATEEWELRPVSLYAETKVAAELDVLAHSTSGFATTCLRFATVYGVSPRMRFDLTVNEFARDAFVNRKLVVYGEQFWRPYVHVLGRGASRVDGARSSRRSRSAAKSSTSETRARTSASRISSSSCSREVPDTMVERVAKQEDPRDYRVGFDKIESRLGYATTRTVPGGIDDLIALLGSGAISDPFAESLPELTSTRSASSADRSAHCSIACS